LDLYLFFNVKISLPTWINVSTTCGSGWVNDQYQS
jgi:hypothetical protein